MERGDSYVERKMPKYRKTDEMRWRYDSDDCVKIVLYTEETRREKKVRQAFTPLVDQATILSLHQAFKGVCCQSAFQEEGFFPALGDHHQHMQSCVKIFQRSDGESDLAPRVHAHFLQFGPN